MYTCSLSMVGMYGATLERSDSALELGMSKDAGRKIRCAYFLQTHFR